MDFSLLDLDGEDAALVAEVRELIRAHVTPEVEAEIARTGSNYDEGLYRAFAERGWILPGRSPEAGGAGLTPLQCELLDLELERADAPVVPLRMTRMTLPAVEQFGQPELAEEVANAVARGDARICLGYTEPDSGSDIAAAKTRAVRHGDDWVVNGSKMFTTEAHHSEYAFLLTRTDPELPKHKGLTMFLMPLDSPGIEIGAIHTIGGERTNVVYYTDVRIPDRYRLGDVNGGWTVLMGPLAEEHGTDGVVKELGPLSAMGSIALAAVEHALDTAVDWAVHAEYNGGSAIDDPVVRERLASIALAVEAAASTPDPMGRFYASEACIDGCAALLNLVGPESVIQAGGEGAIAGGALEAAHRFAQGTAIYGGTVEIFLNITAQHVLGLPRQLPPSR